MHEFCASWNIRRWKVVWIRRCCWMFNVSKTQIVYFLFVIHVFFLLPFFFFLFGWSNLHLICFTRTDTPSFAISRTPGFGYPLREGIEVSLKCDVDSNPPSTPIWQKDDSDPPVIVSFAQHFRCAERPNEQKKMWSQFAFYGPRIGNY